MHRKSIKRNKKKIVAIDFFCGAGGVSHGFIQSGIKVLAGFDNDGNAKFSYEKNNLKSKFYNLDIKETGKHVKIIKSLLQQTKYDYTVFSACAPCQPFSNQKKYTGRDPRKSLMLYFIETIKKLPEKYKPDFIFFENVGPIQTRGKRVLTQVSEYLNRNSYQILSHKIIDASLFGVPQRRKRLIFLAVKSEIIEHSKIFNWEYFISNYKEDAKTVRRVIGKLPKINAGESDKVDSLHTARNLEEINLKRIKQIPKDGGSRLNWSSDLVLECHKAYKGHTDVYGRMSWDDIAPTLTTKCNSLSNGRFGHPEQDRAISLREAAILQTMDNYQFQTPILQDATAKMIGNAVPPKLAKKFGEYIIELSK